MNTSQQIRSNGYGSFIHKVVVRVDSEHVKAFSDTFGVKPFRVLEDRSDFSIQLKSARKSDDETILYEIDYALPETIPLSAWSVLWGESVH